MKLSCQATLNAILNYNNNETLPTKIISSCHLNVILNFNNFEKLPIKITSTIPFTISMSMLAPIMTNFQGCREDKMSHKIL